MSSSSKNHYKVLLSLQNVQASPDLQDDLLCQVEHDETVAPLIVSFGKVLYFEISQYVKNLYVTFLKDGREVAKGSLVVPDDVSSNLEVETTEAMKSSSENGDSSSTLNAEFHLTFINPDAATASPKKPAAAAQATSASKATPKKVTSVAALYSSPASNKKSSQKASQLSKSISSTSGLQHVTSKIDTGKVSKQALRSSSKEKAPAGSTVETFLNQVVNKRLDETQERVGADLEHTAESVYLNRFDHIAASSLVNAGALGASRREGSRDSREETDIDQTASPERLKEKFRNKSKSPSRYGPDMASVLMDTESRRYVNEYRNQLEYLRNIVYVLDVKNNSLDNAHNEATQLRDENQRSNTAREELRKTLLETTKDLKDEGEQLNRLIIDMESQNKDLLRDLKQSNNKVDDIQTRLHAQEIRNTQLESELADARAKSHSGDIYKAQLEKHLADHAAVERRNAETLNALGSRLAELEESLDKVTKDRQNLRKENSHLTQSVNELKLQLSEEKWNNQSLREELESLNNKLKVGQTSLDVYQSVQQLKDSVLGEVSKMEKLAQSRIREVQEYELQTQAQRRDLETAARIASEDAAKANRRVLDLEAQLNELRSVAAKSRRDNIELRNHIITLEQLLCVKEDVYSQLESVSARLEARQNDCDKLRSQLDASSKVLESSTEKILELEKLVVYLRNTVADKEDVKLLLMTVHSEPEEADHRVEGQECGLHRSI